MDTTPRQLLPITPDNWRACVALKVRPEQKNLIATNAFSLAQAAYEPGFVPLGIFAAEKMVGFVMYRIDEGDGRFGQLGERRGWIYRLMVDARYQRQGHGGFAIAELVRQLTANHGCTAIFIDYVRGNHDARDFYLERGFVETGARIHAHDLVLEYRPDKL